MKRNINCCINKRNKRISKRTNVNYIYLLCFLLFCYGYYLINEVKEEQELMDINYNNIMNGYEMKNIIEYKVIDYNVVETGEVMKVLVENYYFVKVENMLDFIYQVSNSSYREKLLICNKILRKLAMYLYETDYNYYIYDSYDIISKKCEELLYNTNMNEVLDNMDII